MDYREELIATVASLYYQLNQSQSQIAARLDLSNSTVSRLIREARDKGIVQISVRMPIPRDIKLEQIFIERFQLKDIYILRTMPDAPEPHLMDSIGQLASNYIERIVEHFDKDDMMGVAWGVGVQAAVSALPDNTAHSIDVVQLLGGVGASIAHGPDITRMVAQKLGGQYYDLHAPVIVERAENRDLFMKEPVVNENIQRAYQVKLAVSGIGSVQDEASSFLRAKLLHRDELRMLRAENIVGEICGQFFDQHGNHDYDINHRIIGIDLDHLRQIPNSIAIARGILKAHSILGVLNGRFVKVLATDDVTARAVLELANMKTPH